MGDNHSPSTQDVTIYFQPAEGVTAYKCNDQEVSMKTSYVKVQKGSDVKIEAVVSETYRFIKWVDEPERSQHENPRILVNVTTDMSFQAVTEKLYSQVQLNKYSNYYPVNHHWKLYQADSIDGTYEAIEKNGVTEFTYGEAVDARIGKYIKLQFVGNDSDRKIERIERTHNWDIQPDGFTDRSKGYFDLDGFLVPDVEVIDVKMYFCKV